MPGVASEIAQVYTILVGLPVLWVMNTPEYPHNADGRQSRIYPGYLARSQMAFKACWCAKQAIQWRQDLARASWSFSRMTSALCALRTARFGRASRIIDWKIFNTPVALHPYQGILKSSFAALLKPQIERQMRARSFTQTIIMYGNVMEIIHYTRRSHFRGIEKGGIEQVSAAHCRLLKPLLPSWRWRDLKQQDPGVKTYR